MQPILPNLLCCQALEVQKYVCVPSASHLWQTWLLHNSGLTIATNNVADFGRISEVEVLQI